MMRKTEEIVGVNINRDHIPAVIVFEDDQVEYLVNSLAETLMFAYEYQDMFGDQE